MAASGIGARRATQTTTVATLGDGGTDKRASVASGLHLLWNDDWWLHHGLLHAATREVFVERVFEQPGWIRRDDSLPGGACGDDCGFPQFGPPDGAQVSSRNLLIGRRNGIFVAGLDSFSFCDRDPTVASRGRLLQLPQPFLGIAQRILDRILGRQRNRVNQFGWEPRRLCWTLRRRVYQPEDRHSVWRAGFRRDFHAAGSNPWAIPSKKSGRPSTRRSANKAPN